MSVSNNVRSQLELDLIDILQLDIIDEDTANRIIDDLIHNGRQSLIKHRDDILEETYFNAMQNQSELLTTLKFAVYNRWSSVFYPSYPWFQSFVEHYETNSFDLYDLIITRTAELGRQKFINSNDNGEQILFVVVQFIFNLNDEQMMDRYTFIRIWKTLISAGLQGLEQLDEFIELENIEKEKKILFLALREYFRPELFDILSECKLIDRRNVYESILNSIAEFGWRLGLDHIRNKITPRMYQEFLKHVDRIAPISDLSPTINEINNKYLAINDTLLDMNIWIDAGEFTSLSSMINSIIDRFCQHKTLKLLIPDCFTPLMYLLKRRENLDNFIQSLHRACHHLSIDYSQIYLRTLIHALLSNSDESLRRTIVNQLKYQNVVPFVQPGSLEINPDIFYIWDYTRPCLLSFGIGPCRGKSSLLNHLFNTKFEIHHSEHLYFQQTIDIDFSLKCSFSIADVHGNLTKECFTKFHSIFHGYLIHIDDSYMKRHPSILKEYSSSIESMKFRLYIVHNSKNKNKISFGKQSAALPNLMQMNQSSKKFLIEDLRKEIYKRTKEMINNPKKVQSAIGKLSSDHHLMDKLVAEYLRRISWDKKASENDIDFPLYVQFSNVCCQREEKRRRVFIEAREYVEQMVDVLGQRYSGLANDEQQGLSSIGNAFDLFVEILRMQTIPRLLMLDYLSSKLTSYVTIEILWRNMIICYDRCSSSQVQTCIDAYLDSIKAGYSFEIIDGDNFYLPHQFLTKVFAKLDSNEQRILVISILGHRHSGKSTLLQYLFGIRNSTRSTKGLYGSFVKSPVDAFNFILVLDIEGLNEGDDEYDRRMAFFCMSISHVIILNVSTDISDRFINMLSICNDSLQRVFPDYSQSSIIHLVLNQIPFSDTIMSNEIRKQYRERFVSNTNLNIALDAVHVLPVAFRNDFSSTRIYSDPNFCEYTETLSMKILDSSSRLAPITLSQWLNTAILFFDRIQEEPAISSFQSLTEHSHDDSILKYINDLLTETLTTDYQQHLLGNVADESSNEIDEVYNTITANREKCLQKQVDERLDIMKCSKSVRERSKNFLQRNLAETLDKWRREAKLKANDQPLTVRLDSKSSKTKLRKPKK